MIINTTYHFPAPRWRVIRTEGWSVVMRDTAARAGFRDIPFIPFGTLAARMRELGL